MERYLLPALLAMAQAVLLLVQLMSNKKVRGSYRYNPHPPGTADTCIRHGEKLARLEEKVDGIDKRLENIETRMREA